jgi:hypothetical protein
MSKLARALILTATVAAMNLAGLTAVASAQSTDEPTSNQDARRPPTQGQVGEAWRQPQVAPAEPTVAGERFRRGERASQEQTTADATVRRLLARERSSIPSGTPAQVPVPVQPPEPSGQPDWLVPAIGVLAAVLALVAGLVMMATRRAGRRVRAGHA